MLLRFVRESRTNLGPCSQCRGALTSEITPNVELVRVRVMRARGRYISNMRDACSAAPKQRPSDIARLQTAILTFAAEREWQQFHDPKNLAMAVAVEAGELMDHFRWVKNDESLQTLVDARTRAAVEDEVADVAILLFEFAAICGIDIAQVIERKLARNAVRYPVALAKGRASKHDRLQAEADAGTTTLIAEESSKSK